MLIIFYILAAISIIVTIWGGSIANGLGGQSPNSLKWWGSYIVILCACSFYSVIIYFVILGFAEFIGLSVVVDFNLR
jgi:hypothetical protein